MPIEPPLPLAWGPSRPPERPGWPPCAYPRATWTHYAQGKSLAQQPQIAATLKAALVLRVLHIIAK